MKITITDKTNIRFVKANEIPIGHACKNTYDEYGIRTLYHIIFFRNTDKFYDDSIRVMDVNVCESKYIDLGEVNINFNQY